MSAPNVAGFVDAQADLRVQMGADVVFRVPTTPEWPEGTKINPVTGLPYEATVKPLNVGYTEVTKRALVILKQASPLRPQSDTTISAAGEMSGMDLILDIAAEDYPDIENADVMTVHGIHYEIRERKPFGLAAVTYRWLIYGEEK